MSEEAIKAWCRDAAIDRRWTHQSAHFRGIPGVLPAVHTEDQAQGAGWWRDAARDHRQIQGTADDRRDAADHRRTGTDPVEVPATRTGTAQFAGTTAADIAKPTAVKDHSSAGPIGGENIGLAVKTFES